MMMVVYFFGIYKKQYIITSTPLFLLGDIIETMALNFAVCLHKTLVLNPSMGLNLM